MFPSFCVFLKKIFIMTPAFVVNLVIVTTVVVCIFIARDMAKK